MELLFISSANDHLSASHENARHRSRSWLALGDYLYVFLPTGNPSGIGDTSDDLIEHLFKRCLRENIDDPMDQILVG